MGRHAASDGLAHVHQPSVTCIDVSPMRDDAAAALGAEWLPLRPNTDVALLMRIG